MDCVGGTMSKIETLTRLIEGAHVMGADGLQAYYDARRVRNALLKHEPIARTMEIQKALKNYRVGVFHTCNGRTRILNYDTKAEVTL